MADRDVIISPEAFTKLDGLSYPLVLNDPDGIKKVVGEATLHVNDKGMDVTMKIWDPEVKAMLEKDNL